MEDIKHTPGPWHTMDARSFGVPYIITDGKITIAQSYEGFSKEDTEANAKLIAAAPDLLEALKNLVDWYGTRSGESNELIPAEKQWHFIAAGMKALAKATATTITDKANV